MNIKDKALLYYKLVDSVDFEKMFQLFSGSIVYQRGGVVISGIENFKEFYLNDRKLKGEHKITEVNEIDGEVIVKGSFLGENSQNNIELEFADFFYFNDEGKIFKRETYFANGYRVAK